MVSGVLVCQSREGVREFMAAGAAGWKGDRPGTAKLSWALQVLLFYSFAFLQMVDDG